MAETGIQPEIYAVILAALLGALIGQFLSFYRQKRQDYEELKSILRLISLLDEQEIDTKIDNEDSFLWYLREELFRSYKQNILYLDDTGTIILSLIRQFPSPDIDQPSGYLNAPQLKNDAEAAYNSLDQLSPLKTVWLSFLGFVGYSQERHGDRLETFLAEEDLQSSIEQGGFQGIDEVNGSPVFGYVIPGSRLLKIFVTWFACILLIVAGTVAIYLSGTYNDMVEAALLVALFAVTVLFFGIYMLIQLLGIPIAEFDQEEVET